VDLVDQFREIGRTESPQGVALQMLPDLFIRIKLGSVGWKSVDGQPRGKVSQGFPGQLRFVRAVVIPEQADRSGDVVEQMPGEVNHLRRLDAALNQLHVDFERWRYPGDGGELGPIAAVTQDRSLTPRRPSSAPVRSQ